MAGAMPTEKERLILPGGKRFGRHRARPKGFPRWVTAGDEGVKGPQNGIGHDPFDFIDSFDLATPLNSTNRSVILARGQHS
jgi:hypothetical protein